MITMAEFFSGRPTEMITRDLLGKLMRYESPKGLVSGYIVEAEAYLGAADSAAHAYEGRRTKANDALYGAPGNIYIYTSRGYYAFDIAVQSKGEPQGILIRGVEPKEGLGIMMANRPKNGSELTNGPGKLMQAFGVSDLHWNNKMLDDSPFTVDLLDTREPSEILTSARIGVSKRGGQTNAPYRYYVAGNPYVSGMRKRDMNLETHGWVN
ncbi:DNA-3-methyladenine glycosylase [Lactobacillus sp. LC28-10]|uniref:Putative 3-methyladenine DNA glycosylase n=1 Tax=Secundilactobacillus angelensis TaxID=2722706 RepID=A0ABX1KY10_9LACO|nr:DNA-3-methyladenine glycosylase [Secundilactobacillus angelensis]MCH5462403.1 DNA-3-methyladenine glycosylase [Secundilactobacillus angelensis]NLR18115.1 DNA-3-methyladenine glycosylase [Secundilactobacillus angelensis]